MYIYIYICIYLLCSSPPDTVVLYFVAARSEALPGSAYPVSTCCTHVRTNLLHMPTISASLSSRGIEHPSHILPS